ncbi:MAG: hypothetical protein CBC76_05785 [Flavobacteriaceae bacterium TMED116]|nr:MAG: hypothetical protein CBC76_05785 [Flavobacteriaceae bacterium TMED116]
MIQRIQNLYLLIICLVNLIYFILSIYGFDTFPNFTLFSFIDLPFYLTSIFSFVIISLFLYKNRNKQLLCNRVNIFFNLFMLIFSLDQLITLNHLYFIIISNLFFLIKANKGIKNDEEIINSIDRIR